MRILHYLKQLFPATLLLVIPFLSFYFVEKQNLNIVFIGDSITDGAYLGKRDEAAPPARAVAYLQQRSAIGKVNFFNQGISGYTTLDFLPPASAAFSRVIKSADDFYEDKQASLIFSIMLGTNDSAIEGTNGAPVSPQSYTNNMKTIIDSLLRRYPESKVILHYPLWYSPNTYNNSKYLAEGLQRLQSYFPEIKTLIKNYSINHPNHVFEGDQSGFNYFKENHLTDMRHETGKQGTFYLHPNQKGASELGHLWADAIAKMVLSR